MRDQKHKIFLGLHYLANKCQVLPAFSMHIIQIFGVYLFKRFFTTCKIFECNFCALQTVQILVNFYGLEILQDVENQTVPQCFAYSANVYKYYSLLYADLQPINFPLDFSASFIPVSLLRYHITLHAEQQQFIYCISRSFSGMFMCASNS